MAEAQASPANQRKQQITKLHKMNEVPRPLMELILVAGTSTKDKKALRLSCKYFRQIVDGKLLFIKLAWDKCIDERHGVRLLCRMKHMQDLKKLIVSASWPHRLFKCLPSHITTLAIDDSTPQFYTVELKDLTRLQSLTTLYLRRDEGAIGGIEHISGLTRLEFHSPGQFAGIGSVAHLAPTLKQLLLWDYRHAQGTEQLTNLEVLGVQRSMPWGFFEKHRQLPLKHLHLDPYVDTDFFEEESDFFHYTAWRTAPTTLTRLTLRSAARLQMTTLPPSITHLQLIDASAKDLKKAATLLPGLRSLDIDMSYGEGLEQLSRLHKFTNLQSLGLHVTGYRDHEVILLHSQDVATAVEKGLKLTVMTSSDELLGDLADPSKNISAWATES